MFSDREVQFNSPELLPLDLLLLLLLCCALLLLCFELLLLCCALLLELPCAWLGPCWLECSVLGFFGGLDLLDLPE